MNEFELADSFLPIYDVSDAVAVVVHADAARTWDALMSADLIEVGRRRPLVGALGALLVLPDLVMHLLHGEGVPEAPKTSNDTAAIQLEADGVCVTPLLWIASVLMVAGAVLRIADVGASALWIAGDRALLWSR